MSQDKNINSLLALSRMEQIMVSMEFQIVTFIMRNHGNLLGEEHFRIAKNMASLPI